MMTKHEDYLVDIVDAHGTAIGQKARKNINKLVDPYNGVYVLVITPQKRLVLSSIPKQSKLPNVYGGKLGVTAATIRRHGEIATEAALRALAAELHITDATPRYLGDLSTTLRDGHAVYISSFYIIHEVPQNYNVQDVAAITAVTADEFAVLHADATTPTLQLIWSTYKDRLPV